MGYGRPPVETQFKAGQSGNPKGRPKGSSGLNEAIGRELLASVTVTEDGVAKRIPKQRVIARQLVHKAAGGDLRATTVVLGAAKRLEDQVTEASTLDAKPVELPAEDQQVLETLMVRLRMWASGPMTPDTEPPASTPPDPDGVDHAPTDSHPTEEPPP